MFGKFLILTLLVATQSWASAPIALVYKGDGSCVETPPETGCSESAAFAAQKAGFQVVYVGPEGREAQNLWSKASIWVQPGGWARVQIQTMTTQLLAQIRGFVNNGGGYVGFCAGGFLATEHFGWGGPNKFESNAIGVLPGNSRFYDRFDSQITEDTAGLIVSTIWAGLPRQVYWELGPYFDETTVNNDGVEVVSRYPDNLAMTVRSTYGQGRVFVTGVHPEAPQEWRDYYKITDSDGLDIDLAVDMMKWSARR